MDQQLPPIDLMTIEQVRNELLANGVNNNIMDDLNDVLLRDLLHNLRQENLDNLNHPVVAADDDDADDDDWQPAPPAEWAELPPLLRNNNVMTLDEIRDELLQVYGFNVNNYPEINNNPVLLHNTLRNRRFMQNNPVGGNKKRKSRQQKINKRFTNRKYSRKMKY
jgi:hypothetical protein